MQFKLRLHHFVLKKVNQLHIIRKKATKPAQIIASLIQGREHKGKWTSFHLLPDLCPLHFSCCHVKLQTSVGSPLMTQLQAVRVWKCSIWKTKWSERSLSGLRGAYQSLQGPRGWCPHLQSTSPVCALCAGLEHWCVWARWRVGKSDFSDFILWSELESKWSLMSPSMTSFRHLPAGQKIQTWIVWFSADSVCWVDVHIGAGL